MSVGPSFRIIEDYTPYENEVVDRCLLDIYDAIKAKKTCEVDLEIIRYAKRTDHYLEKETLERLSKLKRVVVQENVNEFWPDVYSIFYSSIKDTTPPRTITKDENCVISMEHGWFDLIRFKELPKTNPPPPPPIQLSMSPEGRQLYCEFEEGILNFTDSQLHSLTDVEWESISLKTDQERFLEKLGRALFSTYVNDSIAPITQIMIDTFADKELIEVLTPHLQETLLKGLPEGSSELPTNLLRMLINDQLRALEQSLQQIVSNEELRHEIGALITGLSGKSEPEQKEPGQQLLTFMAENYLPDILCKVLGTLSNSLEDKSFDTVVTTLIDALQGRRVKHGMDLARHLTTAATIFGERLNDLALREKLMAALHPLLINIFFPDPANIDRMTKDIITSILYRTEKFFEGLNQSATAWEKIKADKETVSPQEKTLDAFVQKLFSDGTIPWEAKDVPHGIVLLLQEILAKVLFNQPDVKSLKPGEKCVVIILSKLIHNFIKPLCSMKVLHVFVVRFLEGTILLHNPFEAPMPPLSQFDASDVVFSHEIDARIQSIAKQVIHLAFKSSIAKKGAETLLKLIPKMGEKVQQGLNKIFNSGTTLMPGIFAAQFLFSYMPNASMVKETKTVEERKRQNKVLRVHYIDKLDLAVPNYHLDNRHMTIEKNAWIKYEILGDDNRKIKELLSKMLPFGTQSQTLKLIKKIYSYAQHDLFIQVLVVHILRGISEGLIIPQQKDA